MDPNQHYENLLKHLRNAYLQLHADNARGPSHLLIMPQLVHPAAMARAAATIAANGAPPPPPQPQHPSHVMMHAPGRMVGVAGAAYAGAAMPQAPGAPPALPGRATIPGNTYAVSQALGRSAASGSGAGASGTAAGGGGGGGAGSSSQARAPVGSPATGRTIRCLCGSLQERPRMVQCAGCRVWQHGDCVAAPVAVAGRPPPEHWCEVCRVERADPFWKTEVQVLNPPGVKLAPTGKSSMVRARARFGERAGGSSTSRHTCGLLRRSRPVLLAALLSTALVLAGGHHAGPRGGGGAQLHAAHAAARPGQARQEHARAGERAPKLDACTRCPSLPHPPRLASAGPRARQTCTAAAPVARRPAQLWCLQLNDPVPFRCHWPMGCDLRINNAQYRVYGRTPSAKLGANQRDDPASIAIMCHTGARHTHTALRLAWRGASPPPTRRRRRCRCRTSCVCGPAQALPLRSWRRLVAQLRCLALPLPCVCVCVCVGCAGRLNQVRVQGVDSRQYAVVLQIATQRSVEDVKQLMKPPESLQQSIARVAKQVRASLPSLSPHDAPTPGAQPSPGQLVPAAASVWLSARAKRPRCSCGAPCGADGRRRRRRRRQRRGGRAHGDARAALAALPAERRAHQDAGALCGRAGAGVL